MGRRLDPVAMNMGWYYTWGTTPFSYTTYNQIEFVPMIWEQVQKMQFQE